MTHTQHLARYGKKLDVHRVVPGSPYTVDGCVTLCRECHGPKPKSKRGSRPRKCLVVRLTPELAEAMDRFIREKHVVPPRRKDVFLFALNRFLADRGLWPPAP